MREGLMGDVEDQVMTGEWNSAQRDQKAVLGEYNIKSVLTHFDWHGELTCYTERKISLFCSWLPVPCAPKTTTYTIILKWDKILRCFERTTSSTSITIERKFLYMNRAVIIWVSANYSHESYVKTKNISIIPSKAEKCAIHSIRAHQLSNRLIIKWDTPKKSMQYELQYKEARPTASQWILVPTANDAVNVTVSNLNSTSSYVIQLRCIPSEDHHCVCVWSKEILVPHKLIDKPTISANETIEINPGRISIFLQWQITQSRNVIGYYINIERIPNSCNDRFERINVTERRVHLNLSMAYYRFNISAYNEAGESPQITYVVPDFTATVLPGQITAIPQENNTVVTWTPEYIPKCFVVDWGTGKEDMHMKIITKPMGNFTLDHLQPYKLYKIMVHASDICECESFMRHERTFGVTHFYSVQGVPRTGPATVKISNIMKHSAIVKWTEVPAEDCLGFLQGYRINYTDTMKNLSLAVAVNSSTTCYLLTGLKEKTAYRVQISGVTTAGEGAQSRSQFFTTLKYDKGEFEGIVAALCLGITSTMFFLPIICSLMLRRSRKLCWPTVPDPRNSSAIQDVARISPRASQGPTSRLLLQTQTDNDTTSLHVIEEDSKASLKLQPFIEDTEDNSECDAGHSESAGGSPDTCPSLLKIPEKAIATEKERVSSSMRAPLLSDYTSMEFSQKAMLSLALNLLPRAVPPHMEGKLNNRPGKVEQRTLFTPQDYVKQSQVVFTPTGPTLMEETSLS
ncbi:LOW QUALITY PROTEIN: interleukin-6 receptor subunit beta-like [Caretta caretta]|uniref:LOW QUALITY PROTEIN: interleukin-6 receptor subunit beta-like n=1 Tax=Caretta caretta TaxID=8467 RepID=UPI00209425DB|nr:LOW QUALITY PROTEIN: interleukin-6 receptor subunit beta-like [Caretta caretta]